MRGLPYLECISACNPLIRVSAIRQTLIPERCAGLVRGLPYLECISACNPLIRVTAFRQACLVFMGQSVLL